MSGTGEERGQSTLVLGTEITLRIAELDLAQELSEQLVSGSATIEQLAQRTSLEPTYCVRLIVGWDSLAPRVFRRQFEIG